VVAALLRVLEEPGNIRVRHRALWALERLREFERDGVVKAIASTLFEDGPEAKLLRYEAAKVLALHLKDRAPDKTVDVLVEALADQGVRIYKGTGTKVSGGAAEARTGTTSVKESGEGDWRQVVALALGQMGPKAKRPEVLDGLKKLADDSFDPDARKAAKLALDVLKE
jgi:HEAT repeat protein